MKHFLIILLASTSFLSATAQDSLVCITPSTSRYFLESDDERWILREKDSISNQIIFDYSEILLTKDKIIHTYQNDSIQYQKRDEAYTKHLQFVRQELIKVDREAKKQKRIKWGVIGLGILAALLL